MHSLAEQPQRPSHPGGRMPISCTISSSNCACKVTTRSPCEFLGCQPQRIVGLEPARQAPISCIILGSDCACRVVRALEMHMLAE